MEEYPILLAEEAVGHAQVSREGLYYRIRCRCSLSGETLCHVAVRTDGGETKLGILAPEGREFCLDTRVPVKALGAGELHFSLLPRHKKPEGRFVPICPEEPFQYLRRLREAYLAVRNGQPGVVIKEPGRG